MKLNGWLKTPNIHTYYVTGSLEKKTDNQPLKKMLEKIKNGGMNSFLNDPDLKKFSQGLKSSFEQDGYISKDDSLTSIGEDIVETGKSWRSLQGAFLFTVLEYGGKIYLLDAELVNKENSDSFSERSFDGKELKDGEYVGMFRSIKTDKNWADWKNQPQDSSVNFCFDYEKSECHVKVKFNQTTREFTTTENSDFCIIKREKAMDMLKECEKQENVFQFSEKNTKSVQLCIHNEADIKEKEWLQSFFTDGNFSLPVDDEQWEKAKVENICLYIQEQDEKTVEILLNEYLLRKAERSYLGYEETDRFVSIFQNLFVSPNGRSPACPSIMKETKEIYNELVHRAKDVTNEKPIAYLHLQAFIDLLPENTLKPYIEKECVVNLSNKRISFDELVVEVFGGERNIKSISAFSKYTASNGRNARAFMLFAESIANKFGISTTVITTDDVSQNSNKYKESDDSWFKRMEDCKHILLKKRKQDEIKSIHDRYYKVVRNDNSTEWWVMTGELDSLRFNNDTPRIREDIAFTEKGEVKEMTFSKIKQDGVPEAVKTIMEEK